MAKALTSLSLDIALTTRRVGTGDRVTRQILSSSIFHRSSIVACIALAATRSTSLPLILRVVSRGWLQQDRGESVGGALRVPA
jgi:hypothetical protein